MQLNGKPAMSGSIVLAAGDSGVIDTPRGPLTVAVASDAGTCRLDYNNVNGSAIFFNYDTAQLGSYSGGVLQTPQGSLTVRFGLHAYGDGVPVGYAILYTATA